MTEIRIEPLEALIVKPDEVLVLRASHSLSISDFDQLQTVLRQQLPQLAGRILLVDSDWSLAKIEAQQ